MLLKIVILGNTAVGNVTSMDYFRIMNFKIHGNFKIY
jgi:hypothetical protein